MEGKCIGEKKIRDIGSKNSRKTIHKDEKEVWRV